MVRPPLEFSHNEKNRFIQFKADLLCNARGIGRLHPREAHRFGLPVEALQLVLAQISSPVSIVRLLIPPFVVTLLVEVPAMTDNEIQEQIRRGISDAQLLILVDRNQARVLLLQYQSANPFWGFTEVPPATP